MRRTLLQRLALLPILLFGVSVLTFLFIHLTPGDPARALAGGSKASEAAVERVRTEYGLDRPLPAQYTSYIGNVVQGNLGESFSHKRPVSDLFRERFPATMQLVIAALLVGLPTGLLAGALAALHRDSWIDHSLRLLSMFGLAGPLFWFGYIAVWLFSIQLGLFPSGGQLPPFESLEPITHMTVVDSILRGQWTTLGHALSHLALPAMVLAIVPFALVSRFARASFIEALEQDYVQTARAYGVPERDVIRRHVAKNALLPLVTLVGILVPAMLVASLLAEVVFAWPGTGRLLLDAIVGQDYAVVQGLVLIFGALVVIASAIVDVSYTFLDPRIRRT